MSTKCTRWLARLLLIAIAPLAAHGADQLQGKPPDRPNILIIMADDLADWHLGAYGNREIRTPHIDGLAREGIRMANSFTSTPICSPSRATFFTGLVPRQHGIHDFLGREPKLVPEQGQAAPPASFKNQVMISDLLAGAGYECGYVGKWHMGSDREPQHGYSFWRAMLGGSGPYNDPTMSIDGRVMKERGYSAEVYTRYAAEFIRRGHKTPWFLVVSYQNPHTPYAGHPQKYYDMYKDARFPSIPVEPRVPNALREAEMMNDAIGNLRKAAAATTALDDQIPPLLAALDQSGQRERTLVVFTGDNGFLYGRHGAWSKGWATNPINMYEEVIRVPMIFSYPGKLPKGRVLDSFVSFYDVLPMVLEAGGVRYRLDPTRYCGRSYWKLLLGRKQKWDNKAYFNFRYTDAVRDRRYKLVRRGGNGPDELFDLKIDPHEKRDRSNDPKLARVKKQLHARLQKWVEKYQ